MVLQPLSLPPSTTATILPIDPSALACSLEYTRFLPFGYKEVVFNPEQHNFDPPARLYWQIPERFKSLNQMKFLTTRSIGAQPLPLLACHPNTTALSACHRDHNIWKGWGGGKGGGGWKVATGACSLCLSSMLCGRLL